MKRILLCASLLGLAASSCDSAEPGTEAFGEVAFRVTSAVPSTPGLYDLLLDQSNGLQRAYLLYLPPGYDENRVEPYEMIFMFHGGGQSAAEFSARPGMLKLKDHADADDRIVVFPNATPGVSVLADGLWNTYPWFRNDLDYAEELLDHLEADLNVDTDRVFAGGFSNGGRFVNELGTTMHDRFLAIATVSAYYGTALWQPAGPPAGVRVPVFIAHAENDMTLPYGGGPGVGVPLNYTSAQEAYDNWYAENDCTLSTRTYHIGDAHYDATACVSGTYRNIIQFVTVDEMDFSPNDHAWPTFSNSGYEATNGMVNFWDQQ